MLVLVLLTRRGVGHLRFWSRNCAILLGGHGIFTCCTCTRRCNRCRCRSTVLRSTSVGSAGVLSPGEGARVRVTCRLLVKILKFRPGRGSLYLYLGHRFVKRVLEEAVKGIITCQCSETGVLEHTRGAEEGRGLAC